MIARITPERGGEAQGVLRVDISLPIVPSELASLRDWLYWPIETDQINDYFAKHPPTNIKEERRVAGPTETPTPPIEEFDIVDLLMVYADYGSSSDLLACANVVTALHGYGWEKEDIAAVARFTHSTAYNRRTVEAIKSRLAAPG